MRTPAILRRLTPAEMLARQLAEAERNRIKATEHREYYVAIENLLRTRIARLRRELSELAADEGSTKEFPE